MEYKNNETNNDRWIVEHIFPDEHGKYFVEVGACNGINSSSCYVLEKHFQWTGICIEPNNNYYQKLEYNRPKSICENLCLSDINGIVTYMEGDEKNVHPMLGGIKSNLLKYKQYHPEIITKGKEVKKQSITLAKLLQKHDAPKVIHYLAMDIEGSELPVLSIFPFEEYQILAISIEGFRCNDLLVAQGYINVKNPFNTDHLYEQYFVHQSIFSQKNLEINVQHYTSVGNNFKKEHKFPEAALAYQQALNIEPNNANLYALLGTVQKQQGKMSEAISSFQKVLELNPQFPPWIYRSIANALEQLGKYDEAIKNYYQAIALATDSPVWVYHCLGNILCQQQRWQEAIAAYQQAQLLEPDNSAIQRQLKLAQIEKLTAESTAQDCSDIR